MVRNWIVGALLIGILAVLFDFIGHVIFFQQGITEPMPPAIYWISKFFIVFIVALAIIPLPFLAGIRSGIVLAVAGALAFGIVWEFQPAVGYTYSVILHLFHIPAIFLAWAIAYFLGNMFSPRTGFILFLAITIATAFAIAVMSGLVAGQVSY